MKDRLTWRLTWVLIFHRPTYNTTTSQWQCTCGKVGFISDMEIITKHVQPLAYEAATENIRKALERSGMDLDTILKTEETFKENK